MSASELVPAEGQALFDALTQPIEVKEVWYNKKHVTLDGFRFVGCRFDSCMLHINSTHFEIHNCFVDETTTVSYRGDIIKILRLFNRRFSWVYEQKPGFAPVKNDDDTITIITKR